MGINRKNKRLTIGLAIDDILLVGGLKALHGVVDVTRKHDVNLMCFHQNLYKENGQIPASWNSMEEIIDGLIIYQSWPSEKLFIDFRNRFPSLPMVNSIRVYKGCPGLTPDSYQGMKELIQHLVESHGYQRIAFISGPEGNWSAQERYRGYVDALAEHDILLDPNLVTPNLYWDYGKKALSILINEHKLVPGKDFEAIASANDTLALSILEDLQKRGVEVPGKVAVVGFDNDSRSFFSTPPLTTAEYELGSHAAETLLLMLEGKQVPEQFFVPAKVVIRRSCGCQYLPVTQAMIKPVKRFKKQKSLKEIISMQHSNIISEMTKSIENDSLKSDTVSMWMKQIFDNFISTLTSDENEDSSIFLLTLENILYQAKSSGSDLVSWQGVISALRRQLLPYINGDVLLRFESLWHQARLLIEEMLQQELLYRKHQSEQQSWMLQDIGISLITTFDVGKLMDVLIDGLPRLDIPGIYLSLYENTTSIEPGIEWSRLILAYDEKSKNDLKRVELETQGQRFQTKQLVPEGILPDRRYCFIIEPLSFQERQLGFVLFEMDTQNCTIYESLRGQISSALQGALLLEQVHNHTAQLDEIVTQTVATSEEMLATLSETSRQAQAVSKTAQVSIDVSKTGQDAVTNTIAGMKTIQQHVESIAQSILTLSKHTQQIGVIIKAMEDIVNQSKILALNASIQAARINEKGRGFAVVAREMRRLAEQSRDSTIKISNILNEIQNAANTAVMVTEKGNKGTQQGMELASRAGESINNLSTTIEEAAHAALLITASTDQQTKAMDQLVRAVKSIKEASAKTSTSFKEAGL